MKPGEAIVFGNPRPFTLPDTVKESLSMLPGQHDLPFEPSPLLAPTSRIVVGFTGLAGSGKSTAAEHLIRSQGFERGRFAGALKQMMGALLVYRGCDRMTAQRMIDGNLKEIPSPLLNGRTPRHAMQTLGTEWGRRCIADSLWVDTELEATRNVQRLVFDDVRFPNEADAIRAAGGIIVRIERPGAGAGAAGHASEGQPIPAAITIQNDGTRSAFLHEVDAAVRNASWALAATA